MPFDNTFDLTSAWEAGELSDREYAQDLAIAFLGSPMFDKLLRAAKGYSLPEYQYRCLIFAIPKLKEYLDGRIHKEPIADS